MILIFELCIQVDDDCATYLVPKLILQPIVENAIYHGIIPKESKGVITISSYKKEDYIYIDIRDNGVGMEEVSEKIGQKSRDEGRSCSIGLVNVIKLIQLQYGTNSAVEINSTPGEGTTVRFRLPAGAK